MSKVERRKFFDELCRLRALYRLRSEYDSVGTLSVPDAIEYASRILDENDGPVTLLPSDERETSAPNADSSR